MTAVLVLFSLVLSSCGLIVIGGEKAETGETLPFDQPEGVDTGDAQSGETESTPNRGPEAPETAADRAKKRVGALADLNFSGQSFIVATTSNMTFATDGDNYYDRVLLLRDSIVEEKYNIDIITVFADEGRIETDLRNAALSGDYYADLLSVSEYKIGRLASEGLIMNLRSLPFYSTAQSYSRFSGEAAAGNAIYADIGAASGDFSKIWAVFFNREIAEGLGYDLDLMVKDGEWTWDSFDRISRKAADQLGIVGQGSAMMGNEYTDIVFRSGGERLVDNTLGKVPEISFNSEGIESLVHLSCNLIYGNPAAYKTASGATEDDFFSLFGSGQLLFAMAPLSCMSELSVLDVEWGVLPIPKVSEEQEHYYAYTEGTANVLAVPSENNKFDMTGIIIGALNTASYELLAEEYKTSCLYNYFRSIKAMRSMDAVLGSMTFDFSLLYSSGADLLANATYGAVREARTSVSDYATGLINKRKEAANEQLRRLFGEKTFDEDPIPLPSPEPVPEPEPEPEDTNLPENTETEPEDTTAPSPEVTEGEHTEALPDTDADTEDITEN